MRGKQHIGLKQKLLSMFCRSSVADAKTWLRLRNRYQNGRGGILRKTLTSIRYQRLNMRYVADIPMHIPIGEGLRLPHGISGIFISAGSSIGKNCTILQHVILGSNTTPGSKHMGAPVIGDNVMIGAGAVVIGGIRIGNNVRIGANTTVVSDIPDNCTVVSDSSVRIIPCSPERDNSFVSYQEFRKANHR